MTTIHLTTIINAPIERCFDLGRDIDSHMLSTLKTKEKAIAGRKSGFCEEGDTITWQATHFGIKQKLTVKIIKMERPNYFEDVMIKGAFSSMRHQHRFTRELNKTKMVDEFSFKAPLGILGLIAEKLFLNRYMTNLLVERNRILKLLAEKI